MLDPEMRETSRPSAWLRILKNIPEVDREREKTGLAAWGHWAGQGSWPSGGSGAEGADSGSWAVCLRLRLCSLYTFT